MAADVTALAAALELERYVVLGHSFGAFVALSHLVGRPDPAHAGTVVSCGAPSERWLAGVDDELARFEPEDLRAQVQGSWAREAEVRTPQDVAALLADQLPFHFADPRDPRIGDLRDAMAPAVYAPDVLRAAATGAIAVPDVEAALARRPQAGARPGRRATTACARPPPRRRSPPRCRARGCEVLDRSAHMPLRRAARRVRRRGARLRRRPARRPRRGRPGARARPARPRRPSSAARSCSLDQLQAAAQKPGSVRSRPAIAARSSGLREPPAPSSSR